MYKRSLLSGFTTYMQAFARTGEHFIIAVSGGMDSVVLCAVCREAGISFSIAHCNFELRGEESNRDEAFVRALAEQYSVPVYIQHFETETIAAAQKRSIQETARQLRYEWFAALRKQTNAAFVLLAHHADDSVETMVMHFFRGTGLAGLTGIPETTPDRCCLRPLLPFTRAELAAYAAENNLQWVEDSSNSSNQYTRNFFRNELIPEVEKVYPAVRNNLRENMNRFQKIRRFYEDAVAELKKKLIKKENEVHSIPVQKLMQYADSSFLYEFLKDYGFGEKQVPEIMKLAESETGRFMQSDHYRIIRNRRWFLMVPNDKGAQDTVLIEEGATKIIFPRGVLTLTRTPAASYSIKKSTSIAQLDAKEIRFPLLLRKWKPGDYFYPFGLGKKKKLARFFIDLKLSVAEKENTWVVQSGEKIIWVVGHRIDDRFRVSEKTKQVVVITLPTN